MVTAVFSYHIWSTSNYESLSGRFYMILVVPTVSFCWKWVTGKVFTLKFILYYIVVYFYTSVCCLCCMLLSVFCLLAEISLCWFITLSDFLLNIILSLLYWQKPQLLWSKSLMCSIAKIAFGMEVFLDWYSWRSIS